MLFISDKQYYVPVNLCRMIGSIHLFKFAATVVPEYAKLKGNFIWDIIEIDWKEISMILNGNRVNLP